MLDRIGRAQAAQRDALLQQRRFLADASHQLRTPLAIIKAEVELAQSGLRRTMIFARPWRRSVRRQTGSLG